MKLLTEDIIKALPSLYATDNIPLEDKMVICKFFLPGTYWRWFVFEGQAEEDDFCFFGMVYGHEKEMGYFYLSELRNLRDSVGIAVERDLHVYKQPYRNFMHL